MKKYLFTLATALLSLVAVAQDQVPSFPGAEGHGRYVTGAKGKTVVHVTNLNDKGAGSLREAVGTANRIVVFDVAGIIPLASELVFKDNITVLGQTAPEPGITIRYYTVRPGANNVIRFVRFRRGQEKDVDDGADATWQRQKTGIILDHCSFSWSIDEVASFYDNNNFTMQWCTVGESLVDAGHGKGAHGYGGIWGGKLASFHHNMILHVANRSPRFCGARYDWTGYTSNKLYSQYNWANAVQAENVDFRNCVVYNANGCYGGPGGGQINMVGNYYKSGPAATVDRLTTASYADSGNSKDNSKYWTMNSRYYLDGNMIDGSAAGWEKMKYDASTPSSGGIYYTYDENHYYGADSYTKVNGKDALPIRLDEPAPVGEVTTHSAATAFEKIQLYCGASLYRDNVDTRYMTEAKDGTTTYTGSVTGKKGLIDRVSDQGTYELTSASRPSGFDTDGDGIPDAWETANGLNPNSASDGQAYTIDPKKYYTNFEVYANSLVQHIMLAENNDAESAVKDYYPAYKKEDGTVVPAINDGTGTNGTIKWVYDANPAAISQPATVDDDIASQVSTSVSAGAHISYKSKGTVSGVTVTYLCTNTQDATASDNNAVKFTVTPASGYTFEPTGVSFVSNSTVSGTNGCLSAYWLSGDGTTTEVCGETKSSYGSSLTEISKNFSANASANPSSLVINLYKVPTTKIISLAQIVINGIVKSATGIETLTGENAATLVATEYYSLQGARVSQPQRGICIEVKRFSDGTKQSRKVIIK